MTMMAPDSLLAVQSTVICKKCNQNPATRKIRADQVCQDCFCHYIATKTIKRLETYKGRGPAKAIKKYLLPLSFGYSSAALLHLLDQQIQTQFAKMKRAAFELHIIHVDLYLDQTDRNKSLELLLQYKSRWPRHTYENIGLEAALRLESIEWASLGLEKPPTINSESTGTEQLQELIAAMPSATSKADIVSTLLTRLLVDVAKRNSCESILFGDSTTRLAEKTLTETAKGRGFSLPWQVSDGISPYGVGFYYPLRDLLKKELLTFSSLVSPTLTEFILHQEALSHISVSSKLTTIDDLMAQYFESVEENYPSIVANVVRTSSKLKPLALDKAKECGLCGVPVSKGTDGIFGWGGDQNSTSLVEREIGHAGNLCYGCSRSING